MDGCSTPPRRTCPEPDAESSPAKLPQMFDMAAADETFHEHQTAADETLHEHRTAADATLDEHQTAADETLNKDQSAADETLDENQAAADETKHENQKKKKKKKKKKKDDPPTERDMQDKEDMREIMSVLARMQAKLDTMDELQARSAS